MRPDPILKGCPRLGVSIHAPREGCDLLTKLITPAKIEFQFTHPGRGATLPRLEDDASNTVSIHAPREGCDSSVASWASPSKSFNSRTPGGVRPFAGESPPYPQSFNSRTPGGVRLTLHFLDWLTIEVVSIHAPREGCDWGWVILTEEQIQVSIHAPREGCD